MRKFRYIEAGHGVDSLTRHEFIELLVNFDIDCSGYYALVPLTKEEWEFIFSPPPEADTSQ
ncbi:MAG: hypothetical protein NWE76_10705 [Candidatus Bathyarchaeota archaeon]|nr:hypothetical protein [Candidatus Bathyarchaeota archaeon]